MKLSIKTRQELRHLLYSELFAIKSLNGILDRNFDFAIDLLTKKNGKIVITGLGKSGHIGNKIVSTMNSLGVYAVFVHPGDAFHGDMGLIRKDDAVIAISFSGETKELVNMAKYLKSHGISILAITGDKKSKLAKLSDVVLSFTVKEEGSPFNLAPMASATATAVIGDLLATSLSLINGFTKQSFADMHPGGSLGLQLARVRETMVGGESTPIVNENDNFSFAILEMTKKKVGIAGVIIKKGELIGAITDGDIRRFLLKNTYSKNSLAKEAMTKKPKTINDKESLHDAIIKMEKYKITSIFIIDHRKRPIGLINMHDIIEKNFL